MDSSNFAAIGKSCAQVLRAVIAGVIATPEDLQAAWPIEAEAFSVLDGIRDDVYEFWLLEPRIPFRRVLEISVCALEMGIATPDELERKLTHILDRDT